MRFFLPLRATGWPMLFTVGITAPLNAQTTYFQQNFSAGDPTSQYVSTTPSASQVNGLSGLSATATNNAIQFTRPTDSGTGYISRSTNFAGPPTSLLVQFSFEVVSNSIAADVSTGNNVVVFYLGSSFSSGPQNPANADTYARMALDMSTSTTGQFRVRTVPSGGGGTLSNFFSGRQTITFAVNNTGADNFQYVAPDGSSDVLPNDTYDIWVGSAKVADNQTVLTPSQAINNFKFRLANGEGVVQIGNILMRSIEGALPVSLISFTAGPPTLTACGPAVPVMWETAWERSASHYVVERSRDLTEFTAVGQIPAKGEADARNRYVFADEQPLDGLSYYRLQQVDVDGRATFFKPVAVRVDSDRALVAVSPNPPDGQRIHVHLYKLKNPLLRLNTSEGQRVNGRWQRLSETEGVWTPEVTLPTGTYLLNVSEGPFQQTLRVLVQ